MATSATAAYHKSQIDGLKNLPEFKAIASRMAAAKIDIEKFMVLNMDPGPADGTIHGRMKP